MNLELVRKYEPIIRYGKGENFYPMSVEPYIGACSLHHKETGMVLPPQLVDVQMLEMFNRPQYYLIYAAQSIEDEKEFGRLLKFGESLADVRGVKEEMEKLLEKAIKLGIKVQRAILPLDLPEEVQERALENYGGPTVNQPAYYYRVSEAGGFQILQYWFFYAYNDFATSHGGVNDHEADWEQVTLFLKGGKPQWAAYAAHDASGDELRKRWQDIESVDERPVIYQGIGSHASYFTAGKHYGIDTANGDGLEVGQGALEWAAPKQSG